MTAPASGSRPRTIAERRRARALAVWTPHHPTVTGTDSPPRLIALGGVAVGAALLLAASLGPIRLPVRAEGSARRLPPVAPPISVAPAPLLAKRPVVSVPDRSHRPPSSATSRGEDAPPPAARAVSGLALEVLTLRARLRADRRAMHTLAVEVLHTDRVSGPLTGPPPLPRLAGGAVVTASGAAVPVLVTGWTGGASGASASSAHAPLLAPGPSVAHLDPWNGWTVIGLSSRALALRDARGDVRIVTRGASFRGLTLEAVHPRAHIAETSSGAFRVAVGSIPRPVPPSG